MKKYFLLLTLLILFSACIRESTAPESGGFYFSEDKVSNPDTFFSFLPFEKTKYIDVSGNYSISKEEFDKFVKENQFLSEFDESKLSILYERGFLPFKSENFPETYNLKRAYSNILENGKNIYINVETIGLIYHNLFKKIEYHVEREYNIKILKKLLIALMHQSLKEYEQNGGLLKEAAWRNTAFLCVALRLIDNNSPTPFIVSGIVRKELNLINRCEGVFPSPLLSIDMEENLRIKKELCFDYSIFKPFEGRMSKIDNYRRSYLWLSHFKFLLKKDITFLQAILFTQCLKDVTVIVNQRDRNGDELWGVLYGFYKFFEPTEDSLNFYNVSFFLNKRGDLLKKFLELQNGDNLKLLKKEFIKEFGENCQLTFFPTIGSGYSSTLKNLLFPFTGPNLKDENFKYLMEGIKRCDCGNVKIRKLSCRKLTRKEYKFLYCNALCMRFKRNGVLNIFKLFPDGNDFLFISDFNRNLNSFPDYCGYKRTLIFYRKKIEGENVCTLNEDLIRWGYLLFKDYDRYGKRFSLPDISRYEISTLNILNSSFGRGKSFYFSQNVGGEIKYFLDPFPSFYGHISQLLDFLRKKLMMEGLSTLPFDDYLLQYVNILSELKKISIRELKEGECLKVDRIFLKNFFRRIEFIERNGPQNEIDVLNCNFPSSKTYGVRIEINRRFSGCNSGLIYSIILKKYGDGTLHLFVTPISIPFELISSRNKGFSRDELMEIFKRGSYMKLEEFKWVYDSILP